MAVLNVLFWVTSLLRHDLALDADFRCNLLERFRVVLHTIVVFIVSLESKLLINFFRSGARIDNHVEGGSVSCPVVCWIVLNLDLVEVRADPNVVLELAIGAVLASLDQVCVFLVASDGVVPYCCVYTVFHLESVELNTEVVVWNVAGR